MEIRKFVFKRLIEIFVIFFVILTVLFLLFRLAPGDPVTRMVDPTMTPEDAAHLIAQLGLDQPIWLQYIYYIKNFFTGNFGMSFHYGVAVLSIILNRLPNTILLFSTSILLSAFAGIFLGKIASWHKGKKTDTWMTLRRADLPHPFSPLAGVDYDLDFRISCRMVSVKRYDYTGNMAGFVIRILVEILGYSASHGVASGDFIFDSFWKLLAPDAQQYAGYT